MERNILLGVIAMVAIVAVVVMVALSWDSLTGDDGDGDEEIPEGLNLVLTRPERLKEYESRFPVLGEATSSDGFGNNTTIEWKLKDDPIYGEWTEESAWDRVNDHRIEINFEPNMGGTRIGTVVFMMRVYDGDNYSNIVEVPIKLK